MRKRSPQGSRPAARSSRSRRLPVRDDRSLRKIQPKDGRKIYSKSSFNNILAKAGLLFGILLFIYLFFFFEFPANNPDKFSITSMTIDPSEATMKVETDSYKGKLIPLEFVMAFGGGEVTVVGEKETTIVFKDGTKIVLRQGSRKMTIDGRKVKLNAPVVSYKGITLVAGELLEELFPKESSFKDGKATLSLKGSEPAGEYITYTGLEGYLRLVNKENPLTAEYAPTDLVSVNSYSSIAAYGDNTKLRKEAAEAMVKMYEESGQNFVMSSGYRDYQTQTELFKEQVAKNLGAGMSQANAEAQASTIVAVPGTSEHQLGLAVDFGILGYSLGQEFANTTSGQWLSQNSYKYGFVLRYTEAQSAITNIIFEPWHFRYIGYPHSEILYKDKIVYDTYVEILREEKLRYYEADDGTDYMIWLMSGEMKPKKLTYKAGSGIGVSSDNKENIIITLPIR